MVVLERDCATCRRQRRKSERVEWRVDAARKAEAIGQGEGGGHDTGEHAQDGSDDSGVLADDDEEEEEDEKRGCEFCEAVVDERPGQ
jgi:hypothetical protein